MPWEINQRYKSELLPLMIYQFKSTIPVNSNHSREITYFEKIEQRLKTELLHSIIHARIWRTYSNLPDVKNCSQQILYDITTPCLAMSSQGTKSNM